MKMAVGVFAAAVAAIMMNYGSFLQKLALGDIPPIGSQRPFATIRSFTASRTWLKGQGIQLSGAFFDNLAVALAPLAWQPSLQLRSHRPI